MHLSQLIGDSVRSNCWEDHEDPICHANEFQFNPILSSYPYAYRGATKRIIIQIIEENNKGKVRKY